MLLGRLLEPAERFAQMLEGTMVFADVSGFTKLSERLARTGKEGAEHLVDAINACFSALLGNAYDRGGSLLKFGGDAMLLWFEGEEHVLRACAAAAEMRRSLREVGRIRAGRSDVVLRMSVGVHSGRYAMFLVGDSHPTAPDRRQERDHRGGDGRPRLRRPDLDESGDRLIAAARLRGQRDRFRPTARAHAVAGRVDRV